MAGQPKEANAKMLSIDELALRVTKLVDALERVKEQAEDAKKRGLTEITVGLAAWGRAKDDLKRFARSIEDGIDLAEDSAESVGTGSQAHDEPRKTARKAAAR